MNRVIVIGEREAIYWSKVAKKLLPDSKIDIYDRNYDGNFSEYDLSIITVSHPLLIEDSLKEAVPTICTTIPTKQPEQIEKLCKISDFNNTPFIASPTFIFGESFNFVVHTLEHIGKINYVGINFNDFDAKDILWELGRDAASALCGILPSEVGVVGVGLHSGETSKVKQWINCTLYVDEKSDVSININLSRIHPEKGREIVVVAEGGSFVYRPTQKEICVKDHKGRKHNKIDVAVESEEEAMVRFFLENITDGDLNGDISSFTIPLLSEIEGAFKQQAEQMT